jgi:hypothetical protein
VQGLLQSRLLQAFAARQPEPSQAFQGGHDIRAGPTAGQAANPANPDNPANHANAPAAPAGPLSLAAQRQAVPPM